MWESRRERNATMWLGGVAPTDKTTIDRWICAAGWKWKRVKGGSSLLRLDADVQQRAINAFIHSARCFSSCRDQFHTLFHMFRRWLSSTKWLFSVFFVFFPTFAGCFGRCCFEAFPFIVGASAGFGCSAGNAAFHLRWASKSASLETIEKLLYTHTQAWLTHWWTGRQKQQVSTGLSCHHHPQPSSTLHTHYVCVPVIMDN